MTTYQQQQKELFDQIENDFKMGKNPSTIVDPVDEYENDDQICLTSIGFVSEKLQTAIKNKIIDPLKDIEPKQYYYQSKSLHLTIQNIRTINKPPLFTNVDVEKTKKVFSKIVPKHPRIEFKIKGLFELPTSLGLRAYSNESLKYLCQSLRKELIKAGIPDNKKYASDDVIFGNISIVRYNSEPSDQYFKTLKSLKGIDLGSLTVKTVHLITTNSVCHPKKTKILGSYKLK